MKQTKKPMLYDALADIPEAYLDEAEELKHKTRRPSKTALIAAALAILLLIPTVLLFAHITSPAYRYRNHPYFAVISSLLSQEEQTKLLKSYRQKSFWEQLDRIFYTQEWIGVDDAPSSPTDGDLNYDEGATVTQSGTVKGDPSFEITDNQVNGILEADVIKRTETHIFYLAENTLTVYTIEGENSQKVSEFTLNAHPDLDGISFVNLYIEKGTLLFEGVSYEGSIIYTDLTRIPLENCLTGKLPEKLPTARVEGYLLSTRLADHALLVLTEARRHDPLDVEIENFLPYYRDEEGYTAISPDKITVPDAPSGIHYTTAYLLDSESLAVKDEHALLGTPSAQYVSENALYLVSEYTVLDTEKNGDPTVHEVMGNRYLREATTSYIESIRYTKDGFEVLGGVTLEGSVKNQYSMDEYEGILRVAVTNEETWHQLKPLGNRFEKSVFEKSASLYLVSLDSFEVISSANKFAPIGESVQSVRFDHTLGYICTAEVKTFTDPVYRFDLSDPYRISSLDTGTIDGYSTSLVELAGGDLLGIGYGENRDSLKLEVYRKSETSLESVTSFVIDGCLFTENYKAYYINREASLFGIPTYIFKNTVNGVTYYPNKLCYLLFHYDGTSLSPIVTVPIGPTYEYDTARGFVDGIYLYTLTSEGLTVTPISIPKP